MKAYYLTADWTPKPGYIVSERERETKRAFRGNFVWNNIKVGVVELPMPKIKSDEVLIKIGACGVCGSDIHMIEVGEDGYTIYPGHTKFPLILGHEFAGEVVETGKDVKSVKIGDLVAVEQINWCGKCLSCRISKPNQCIELEEVGLTKDGGFAEFAAVNEKFCCVINPIEDLLGDKLSAMEAGALVEPTCVAYSGMVINSGGFKPGGFTAVFGAGPVGLAAIGLAKAFGSAKIFAFDVVEQRLKLSKDIGADYTFNPIELQKQNITPAEIVMDLTKGLGASMIVEAAGNGAKTYPEIAKCLAIGAKVVQLGLEARSPNVDLTQFQIRHALIIGSLGHAGNDIYPSVIRMMSAGRIDMRKIVTARYQLKDTGKAIAESKSGNHGKVLVGQNY